MLTCHLLDGHANGRSRSSPSITTAASDAPETYVPKWPNPGVRREQLSRGGGCVSARFAGRARVGLIASSSVCSLFLFLFLCSLCFFSVPIMESLMSRSGAPYRSNLPNPWARIAPPRLLDAVLEQQRTQTTNYADNSLEGKECVCLMPPGFLQMSHSSALLRQAKLPKLPASSYSVPSRRKGGFNIAILGI